jgi:aryl-alcohol dehydrogenase-like predicted oxidoreductase
VVGRALAGRRERVIVATKCGRIWKSGDTNIFSRLKKDGVRAELEASLRRLKTDRIDLYQLHWPDPPEDIEEAWEEIARQVQAGKIRYAGVIVYSPMQMGLLTGTFSRERVAALPPDDLRGRNPFFTEPQLSRNLELVEKLQPIAARGAEPDRTGHRLGAEPAGGDRGHRRRPPPRPGGGTGPGRGLGVESGGSPRDRPPAGRTGSDIIQGVAGKQPMGYIESC